MADVKPDYGLDAPAVVKKLFVRGGVFIGFALLLWLANRNYNPQGGRAMLAVLGAIGIGHLIAGAVMVWSSRVGKFRERDQVFDALAIKGDERVLDVGCGRGLFLIGAAKRLTSGRAIGIDIWSTSDLAGNSAAAARANAKLEGVADKIRVDNGDARKLPYPDAHYDVVVSSLALHNIKERPEREKALAEMLRVLKTGGKLAILDIFHTGQYAEYLGQHGATLDRQSGLSFLWCLPTRWLIAKRQAS